MIRFLKQKRVFLPILSGVLFSIVSNRIGLDLAIEAQFYDASADLWRGQGQPLMDWLYNFGVAPALIVAVIGLLVVLLGYSVRTLQPWRKVGCYLFLVLALGNGLIVNGILKEFWGRPRPSQVDVLGGTQAFEPSLWIDLASSGKSFPCGHCTMGFYFFAVALLLRGRARVAAFMLSLLFGGIIGLSRMSYGGHFLTDVVWAGIIMWLLSIGLHQWMGLDKKPRYTEQPPKSAAQAKRRKAIRWGLVPLTALLLLTVALRTPRDKTDRLTLETPTQDIYIELDLRGVLKFETEAQTFSIETHGQGFGAPKTKLLIQQEQRAHGTLIYHTVRGFFSDLRATTRIQLPAGHRYEFNLHKESIEGILINGTKTEITNPIIIDLR